MFSMYQPGRADLYVTHTAMKAWRVLVHAKRAEPRKFSKGLISRHINGAVPGHRGEAQAAANWVYGAAGVLTNER
jgi:hypothetical protein